MKLRYCKSKISISPCHLLFHDHLNMILISFSLIDMQELVKHMISFEIEKSYWQTIWCCRVSTALYKVSILPNLQSFCIRSVFCQICSRSNDLVCKYSLSRGQILFDGSYQSLSCSWHTDFNWGLLSSLDLKTELTPNGTGQQEMLTPPWHLIPPLVYPEVPVCLTGCSPLR
jgi:hypothetical protein